MNNLEATLRAINEKTHAELETLTEPDMKKTSPSGAPNLFVARIRKRTRQSCYLCSHYADEVNAQRAREGKPTDFVSRPRRWGKHVEGTPLIEHNGQLYLEFIVDQVDQVQYELDGFRVPQSVIEPWLSPKAKSPHQGVDDEVAVRLVKLSNLVSVSLN